MTLEFGQRTTRIAIIGCGQVGAASAYALILCSVASEIILVDVNEDLRDGQVLDLSDATYRGNSSTRVRAGTHEEAGKCDIIVIAAGAGHKTGETRYQLVDRNIVVLSQIINSLTPIRSDAIVLVVANHVDVLTYFAQQLLSLPTAQVIGTGTFLDSLRLRGLLAEKAEISPSSIDAYVLGEHGDSQFVAWSIATVGGVPIDDALPLGTFDKFLMATLCKQRAQMIIEEKGSTYFGIGSVVSSICASILSDKRNIRPISHYRPELGCCLSLPVVLGRKGVEKQVPVPLSEEENDALLTSAKRLTEAINTVKKTHFTDRVWKED